jgi:hypothetical protein
LLLQNLRLLLLGLLFLLDLSQWLLRLLLLRLR